VSEAPEGPVNEFNRRQYERFRIKVPVYIAEEGGTFRKIVSLESRDVSVGGLCFETSRPIRLHAKSKVVVSKLGDLAEPVLIHARVAYLEQDPVTGRQTVGLEFLEFANVTPEDLMPASTPGPAMPPANGANPLTDPDPGRSGPF
jgi:c-di-GMP-binding flagellar brake protein YcgR